MKSLNLYAWEDTDLSREDRICSDTFDEINFYFHDETRIYITPKTAEHINTHRIKVNALTISVEENFNKNCLVECGVLSELINVSTFPLYWILKTHNHLIDYKNFFYVHNVKKENFIHPFLSFNGKAKPHRRYFIDALCSNNLLDSGVVSYHGSEAPDPIFTWKCYAGGKMRVDGSTFSSYTFNETFVKSFLHIPTESETDVIAISEKTAIPLLNELPFLVLGAPGFHAYLKQLGFKLYDELFDYSFDEEENLELRIAKLIDNIHHVVNNKDKLDEFYSILKPKLEFNKRHALSLVSSINCVPDMLKNHYYEICNKQYLYNDEYILIENFNFFNDVTKQNLSLHPRKSRIRKRYYNYWYDNFSYDKVINDILEYHPEEITIFGEHECEVWATQPFVNLVNEMNIKVNYTTLSVVDEKYLNKVKDLGIRNINVESWDTYYFRHAADVVLNLKNTDKRNEYKYPFICLNNRAHLHRCYVIDFMAKYNLINTQKVSWIDPLNEVMASKFKFKYFDGNRVDFDNMKTNQDSYIIPNEYYESFVDFVTESSHETIAISEKTIKPLVFKKPFVIMGAAGINKHLEKLGFKLYDEIIDYSFDEVEDIELRAELYVKNMKNISELKNFDDIYSILLPKVEHNYNLCFELAVSMDIPKEVKKILPIAQTNPFDEELGCFLVYKRLFGDNRR